MHSLVRTVFSKLYTLDPEEEEAKLLVGHDDEAAEIELRMSVTAKDEEPLSEEDSSTETEAEQEKQGKATPEPKNDDVPPIPMSPTSRPECMSTPIFHEFTLHSVLQMAFLQYSSYFVFWSTF